jgi:hypothetical protein
MRPIHDPFLWPDGLSAAEFEQLDAEDEREFQKLLSDWRAAKARWHPEHTAIALVIAAACIGLITWN